MNDIEHRLQAACVRWFAYEYPALRGRLFAVPNGGRRDAVTGARLKAEGVLSGVADLILLCPTHQYGALLIEMKTPKGRQSPAQQAWQSDVTRYGDYQYAVCRSFADFCTLIKDYLSDALSPYVPTINTL